MELFDDGGKELRPYQKDAVDALTRSGENLLLSLPTGAGKTVVAKEVMKRGDGVQVFIVPRIELIAQASKEFGDCDVIWADKTSVDGKHIMVASKQSMSRHEDCVPRNATFIFDEAHIGIKQTKALVDRFEPRRVLGLTATPERMDGLSLLKAEMGCPDADMTYKSFGVWDRLVRGPSIKDLIDGGYLSPLRYYARHLEGVSGINGNGGEELDEGQVSYIMDTFNVWGDLVSTYEKLGVDAAGQRRLALGFAPTVRMASRIARMFQAAGHDFRVIHGEMDASERARLIGLLSEGKIEGLVNAALLTYGFDCPPVSYAFLVRGICSRPLWFQIAGRILRRAEGKEDAVFVDHTDTIDRFRTPTCAMPLLDPFITWNAGGESHSMRIARKQRKKEERKTLDRIMQMLPAKMREVKEGSVLEAAMNALEASEGELRMLKDKLHETERKNEALAKRIKEMQTAQSATIVNAAGGTLPSELSDSDTYEFVRINYARARRECQTHKAAVESLLNDLQSAGQKPCMARWVQCMSWWERNYKARQ